MTIGVEPNEATIEARALQFNYVEWGAAAALPIVLLHGLTSTCRIWDPTARAIQDGFHIFAPDQRGHADTSWPEEPSYTTNDFVLDLEVLVNFWELERFVLVGLSMGGMNAMAFGAKHPERVSHLVLVDIPPAIDRERNQVQRQIDKALALAGHPKFEDHEAALRAARLTNQITSEEALRHRLRYTLKQLDDGQWTYKHDPRVGFYWQPSDLWNELPKLDMPVLIVRGGKTQVLSERTAQRMLDTFPNADLITIADAGHTVPADEPAAFVQALQDFLERN